MSDYNPDDIDESDIPDLPDAVLERVVAEWLGELRERDERHTRAPDPAYEWNDDETVGWPAYTSDDAAAWRLLTRIRQTVMISETRKATHIDVHGFADTSDINPRRALTEAAAHLAIRGVEPVEVSSE